jgi:hypothetical protein
MSSAATPSPDILRCSGGLGTVRVPTYLINCYRCGMALLLRLARVSCAQLCGNGSAYIRPLISLASFTTITETPCRTDHVAHTTCSSQSNMTTVNVDQGTSVPLAYSWMRVGSFASNAVAQCSNGMQMSGRLRSCQRSSHGGSPVFVAHGTGWRSAVDMQAGMSTQSEPAQQQALRGLAHDASAAAAATQGVAAQRTAHNGSRPQDTAPGNASGPDQRQVLYRGKVDADVQLLLTLTLAHALLQPAGREEEVDNMRSAALLQGIVLFRLLVRLKVFQLLGIAGISVVATTLLSQARNCSRCHAHVQTNSHLPVDVARTSNHRLQRYTSGGFVSAQGPVATLQMGVLTALVAGCGIASTTLWYFSRRYLGEISLSPSHPGYARFSVLDFWGRREVRSTAAALPLHLPYAMPALTLPA